MPSLLWIGTTGMFSAYYRLILSTFISFWQTSMRSIDGLPRGDFRQHHRKDAEFFPSGSIHHQHALPHAHYECSDDLYVRFESSRKSGYWSWCIALIVRRIWRIRKSLKHRSTVVAGSPLTNVLIVLVESGLMYTLSIVILFVLYMISNNAQYGVSNAVCGMLTWSVVEGCWLWLRRLAFVK